MRIVVKQLIDQSQDPIALFGAPIDTKPEAP